MLPDFLIIGAMKAGTSSLFHYLKTHPQIFMPAQKEVDFFSHHWESGTAWYEAHFAQSDGRGLLVGEASPNYTKCHFWPETPRRIAELLPAAKLIYVTRDPVARARSNYLHQVAQGVETRPLQQALVDESDPRTKDYVYTSCYGFQLLSYLEHVDPGQILVLTSESLLERRSQALESVFRFLDVDPGWTPPNLQATKHRSADKRTFGLLANRLRQTTAYRTVAEKTPMPIKRRLHRFATRPLQAPPVPADLRGHLMERLSDDQATLRRLAAAHGWDQP